VQWLEEGTKKKGRTGMNFIVANQLAHDRIAELRRQADGDRLARQRQSSALAWHDLALARCGDALVAAGDRLRARRPATEGMEAAATRGALVPAATPGGVNVLGVLPFFTISRVEYRHGDVLNFMYWRLGTPISAGAAPMRPLGYSDSLAWLSLRPTPDGGAR
jgi:hypothetical protein